MFGTQVRSNDSGTRGVSADFAIIAAVILLALAAPLSVLAARWATPFSDRAKEPKLVELEFMDRRFAAPDSWLSGTRTAIVQERISLRIPLPDIIGAEGDPQSVVGLTLTPADGALAPSERPRALYSRFLSGEASAAPGGLIRRRFRDGTPYEGEALLIAPPDGRAFSARCPAAPASAMEPVCFAELRFGEVDAHLQIAMRDIDQWERVVVFVRALVVGVARR
ncbi:MAG: hypothetical protein EA385_10280 [Salinarimonadaceae bacterium]|nr:MAG: hypothetical protein EA385_10280 [Salinarimonadaceae bacterium]